MKSLAPYVALFAAIMLFGCASSSPEEESAVPGASTANIEQLPDSTDLSSVFADEVQEEDTSESSQLVRALPWSPRFVQTGLASGIMVEFTGVKKGKTLRAKHANIELRRYLSIATADADASLPPLSGPMRAQATINNLHQAFFKIQPGRYFFRVTNPWADRREFRDLDVRDGEYSVVPNDVYAVWLRRTKQLPDSSAKRP